MVACRAIIVVVCMLTFGSSTLAADGWWRFGKSSEEPAASAPPAKKTVVNTWWPWSNSPPKKKSNQPSPYQKFTSGTKNAWNKTIDFLNPFDNKSPAKQPPISEPSGSDWLVGPRPTF